MLLTGALELGLQDLGPSLPHGRRGGRCRQVTGEGSEQVLGVLQGRGEVRRLGVRCRGGRRGQGRARG
jgi:hypothetical protein